MSPPFLGATEAGTEVQIQPVPIQKRGPAPPYHPPIGPNDIPANDPRWAQLAQLRQKAWNRGITEEQLTSFERGPCPDQVWAQRHFLEYSNACWEAEHQATPAA